MTLTEIFDKYRTDKGSVGHGAEVHNYGLIYEQYFESLRNQSPVVLEIGVLKGNSLRSWRDYFGNGTIYGVDNQVKALFKEPGLQTFFADQSKPETISELFPDTLFDIIIDDGSHESDHQQKTFDTLFTKLKSGGYYVIEDIHAPFIGHATRWKRYPFEGGTDTTYEFMQNSMRSSKYITPERLTEHISMVEGVYFDKKVAIIKRK